MEKNKNLVSVDDAIQRADDNTVVLDTKIGKVKASKNFCRVCAGIGGVSAVAGVVETFVLSAMAVAPVLAIGLGATALVAGSIMAKNRKREEEALIDTYNSNVRYANALIKKYKTPETGKSKKI